MSLKFKKVHTFALAIFASIPTEDPKKPITGSFTVWFKYRTREERDALAADMNDGRVKDRDFFNTEVVKVDGLEDADAPADAPKLSSDEQKEILYSTMELAQAMFRRYWDHIAGVSEAAAKNSKKSLGA